MSSATVRSTLIGTETVFKNFKISTKVFGGFAVVLALLIVISLTSTYSLMTSNDGFQRYRLTTRELTNSAEARGNFLVTELSVMRYLADRTEKSQETARQSGVTTLKNIDALLKIVVDKDRTDRITTAQSEIKTFLKGFEEVAIQEKIRNDTLENELNKIGPELERSLTKVIEGAKGAQDTSAALIAGNVRRHLLLMRLYVMKFLLDNRKSDFERALQESASMEGTLQQLNRELQNPMRRGLANKVGELRKAYEDAFLKTHDAIVARNRVVADTISPIGKDIDSRMASLKTTIRGEQDKIGPETTRIMDNAVTITMIVALASIIIGIFAAWLIGGGISRPIRAITEAMNTLAGGDKTIEIPGKDRKDEIGLMANAVQVFKDNMIQNDEMAANEAAQAKARQQRAQHIENLTSEFDTGVSELLNAVASAATEMESTATSMAGIANDTNHRATTVASASEQASANVQTVAAATDELNSSVQEISRQVTLSAEIAGRAATQAETTDGQVRGLADAAQRIGEVVSLISAIAEQTNLLALNATIEAARAGDAGKGFAVVAAEVKELATQTGKATEDIGKQINSIQSETAEAVNAIQSIGSIIREVNEIAASIASAVEEQSAATGEIARNVEQAATGTQEVTSNIMEVTQSANETGAAATQVTGVAADLSQKSEQLKHQVERFLNDVRSA